MTRTIPRTNLHSSELLRCLTDLASVDAGAADTAFAEKLGLWIHFADAITLSAVHSESGDVQDPGFAAAGAEDAAIIEAYDCARSKLDESIRRSCTLNVSKSRTNTLGRQLDLSMDEPGVFAPFRRFYEAHQRDMELTIPPLRHHVRQAVAAASPRLKKLADLDATLEKILRDRESKLLAKIPTLLKSRFELLFRQYQQPLPHAPQLDRPVNWRQSAELSRFCQDMQMLLLAEVDLRLQPTLGLIEAFRQDTQ